jgi:hypothetical protein
MAGQTDPLTPPRKVGEVKLFHDQHARPDEWRVEQIDRDGGCDVVIFTGPHAEARARRFADLLRKGGADG